MRPIFWKFSGALTLSFMSLSEAEAPALRGIVLIQTLSSRQLDPVLPSCCKLPARGNELSILPCSVISITVGGLKSVKTCLPTGPPRDDDNSLEAQEANLIHIQPS
jgi:hypothetical protein